jgi:hypothetical protein
LRNKVNRERKRCRHVYYQNKFRDLHNTKPIEKTGGKKLNNSVAHQKLLIKTCKLFSILIWSLEITILVPEVLVPPYYKLCNLYKGTAETSGGTECESHFHAELPFENLQNRFYIL